MSESTVVVLRRHRASCPMQSCKWCTELDSVIAAVAELIEREKVQREALARLVAESVHPYDGGEYEDGEWEALDQARAALARVGGAK